MNTPATPAELNAPLTSDDFEALEDILDDLRARGEDVPQWEFCEGAIAALLCTRRLIMPSEYFPVLLGTGDDGDNQFQDKEQFTRFVTLWTRRWNEVAQALGADVETLEDERTYEPEVMDVRGAVASLPDEARAEIGDQELPAFAQVWALGFMFVVENWPEEWAAPRDKEAATVLNEALDIIVSLTEDDTGTPTVSMHTEDGPPSVSDARLNDFGAAIWAVYDLRELWQSIGPRVETVRKADTPGRNDPCWCGSGKKYKKCHGLN
ncbi:MAG: zinc chelation protein SecC [Comamonadaceae bacterium]|nr:zinc chelation protein SecC [Comamonadaceae bacterium]